jgi:hypothetical protein
MNAVEQLMLLDDFIKILVEFQGAHAFITFALVSKRFERCYRAAHPAATSFQHAVSSVSVLDYALENLDDGYENLYAAVGSHGDYSVIERCLNDEVGGDDCKQEIILIAANEDRIDILSHFLDPHDDYDIDIVASITKDCWDNYGLVDTWAKKFFSATVYNIDGAHPPMYEGALAWCRASPAARHDMLITAVDEDDHDLEHDINFDDWSHEPNWLARWMLRSPELDVQRAYEALASRHYVSVFDLVRQREEPRDYNLIIDTRLDDADTTFAFWALLNGRGTWTRARVSKMRTVIKATGDGLQSFTAMHVDGDYQWNSYRMRVSRAHYAAAVDLFGSLDDTLDDE